MLVATYVVAQNIRVQCVLLAAVVFDAETCKQWMISSLVAFVLDALVYHSFALFLKATAQFLLLVVLGSDTWTVPRATGKLAEQVRWFCTDFFNN